MLGQAVTQEEAGTKQLIVELERCQESTGTALQNWTSSTMVQQWDNKVHSEQDLRSSVEIRDCKIWLLGDSATALSISTFSSRGWQRRGHCLCHGLLAGLSLTMKLESFSQVIGEF